MNTKTKQQLQAEIARLQERWLKADAAANQALSVIRCAQEKIGSSDEGEAYNLIDASVVVLELYCCEDTSQ